MRLIDADKLKERWHDRGHDGYNTLVQMLCDVPTVDAVPVVHCKDCKHKRDSKNAFDWDGVTPLCVCGYSTMVNRGYEFCSWGERKTD